MILMFKPRIRDVLYMCLEPLWRRFSSFAHREEETLPEEKRHPSSCPRCGQILPYFGRRDLLQALTNAADMLEKPQAGPRNEVQVSVTYHMLRETIRQATGRCVRCDVRERIESHPDGRDKGFWSGVIVPPTPRYRCKECGARIVEGLGPNQDRCPTLHCTGELEELGT